MPDLNLNFDTDNTLPTPPRRRFPEGALVSTIDTLCDSSKMHYFRRGPRGFRIVQFCANVVNIGKEPLWLDADTAPSGDALRQWFNAGIHQRFPKRFLPEAEADLVENTIRHHIHWHEGRENAVVAARMLSTGMREVLAIPRGRSITTQELHRRIRANPKVNLYLTRISNASKAIDIQTRALGASLDAMLFTDLCQQKLLRTTDGVRRAHEGRIYALILMVSGLHTSNGQPLIPDELTDPVFDAMRTNNGISVGVIGQLVGLCVPSLPMVEVGIRENAKRVLTLMENPEVLG